MSSRDLKEFIEEDVAVKFESNEEVVAFLDLCAEKELKWGTGEIANAPETACLGVGVVIDYALGRLAWSSLRDAENFVASGVFRVLPASDFLSVSQKEVN